MVFVTCDMKGTDSKLMAAMLGLIHWYPIQVKDTFQLATFLQHRGYFYQRSTDKCTSL